ncbi:hypothetical protein GUITHDRAFT_115833 [Guillardia theta CCMP2712]|uniref:Uncharacterized protein n=1 Tax=Guillardia theta (strain CCMP2712) TaxID=905079 RepID=L1IP78_GUITC|nr:hypothetical protein GUITHDRAFT_115833 [Guillardia theta CCMP2712]EKX38073.1 hypothetical protein GUITHDRAFT_115833 [Guillardia theta CCMP2712]|eukprot:XP_005825053.1 hypothetical protein GUITHDRAFT_115833 [Guillardia theta CCMP2712]
MLNPYTMSASEAGLLGDIGAKDHENVVGALASLSAAPSHARQRRGAASSSPAKASHQHQGDGKARDEVLERAAKLKESAETLLSDEKQLRNKEKSMARAAQADLLKYQHLISSARRSHVARRHRATPKKESMAKDIARMVIQDLEPKIEKEDAKISNLQMKMQSLGQHVDTTAKAADAPDAKNKFPPAFPDHWHHSAVAKRTTLKQPATSFDRELKDFLRPSKAAALEPRVHGHRKSMADYLLVNATKEEIGQGAPGDGEETTWFHPEHKGSPCSVSGNCNHNLPFKLQDHEYWREKYLAKYRDQPEGEEGKGEKVGEEAEKRALGNEVVMRSLDDFVTPNDAYVHNLLTSGAYGVDHFGHMPPKSEKNEDLMYGRGFKKYVRDVWGKELQEPGKGGMKAMYRDGDYNKVGDEVIGGEDKEVPIGLTMPEFPGTDHDHFDHWKWDSSMNQELLNGAYWRHLRKDGFMDRVMPADEAHLSKIGASHDRKPLTDFVLGSWNQGFGYGPTKKDPQPFIRARKETHGADHMHRVFTGTHESIEERKGVVRNMEDVGANFKGGKVQLHTKGRA